MNGFFNYKCKTTVRCYIFVMKTIPKITNAEVIKQSDL